MTKRAGAGAGGGVGTKKKACVEAEAGGKGKAATDMEIQQPELGDLMQRQPRGSGKGHWATSYNRALFSVVIISLRSVPTLLRSWWMG